MGSNRISTETASGPDRRPSHPIQLTIPNATTQIPNALDQRLGVCANRGKGVRVYILDTGCRTTHAEFRAGGGSTATRAATQSVVLSDGSRPYGSGGDGNGHGTHVSGIAAGLNVGIAPAAVIRCIKVLGNDGSAPM